VGSVVWSAKAGDGEITPEINIMTVKPVLNKRLKDTRLACIVNSPLKLIYGLEKSSVLVSLY